MAEQDVEAVRGRRAGIRCPQRDLLRAHADPHRPFSGGVQARSGHPETRGAVRLHERDVAVAARRACVDQVRGAQEVGDELGARRVVELDGVAELIDPAVAHDGDRVGHRHRLLLVVRYVHERDADIALDVAQLELELLAQPQVERSERLVEQQRARTIDERASERHALLLAA